MIKRYDLGEAIRKSGDYWSTMTESKDGDYVTHEDHRAAVRELVEALQAVLIAAPCEPPCEAFNHSRMADRHLFGECKPLARYLSALERARAAIAKHQEGKE